MSAARERETRRAVAARLRAADARASASFGHLTEATE